MKEILTEVALSDGSANKFTIFAHQENTSAPVFVLFPAMGTPASYYNVFAQELARQGVIVITADLRGIGHSSVRPKRGSDFGFREMIELDYKGILDKIHSLYPDNKKFIIGHSLGGILGSLYSSRFPGTIDGLILVAAVNIHYKGWSGASKWGLLVSTQFFRILASVAGYFPGDIVGFGGRGARTVIKDWSYTAQTGRYRVSNSRHDYEQKLKDVILPILAISFSADTYAPKRAVEKLLSKFHPASKIKHIHLTHISGSHKKYSHYNWVKNNAEVISIIRAWAESIK
ncbi:MAG TPA: alpha/beta fold hydrolase [Chitinophagales bacterium]|nr:alpha/beta fold hydrolase [Chitinophagales bacterium]